MKWIIVSLFFNTLAWASCSDVVVSQWKLNLAEKSLSLVNFAPQSVKRCHEDKKNLKWVFEIKKNGQAARFPIELPPLPQNEDIKTSQLDIYFEAPLPLWAKKAQLKIIDSTDQSVLATGDMK